MESASDSRFDTNCAVEILLDVAQARSLDDLFQRFVEDTAGNPRHACVQVWLIDKGDLCATCPQRPACPVQSRCLHLAAARRKSISASGKRQCPFEDLDARVPLGVGPIGETVAAGQGKNFLVSDEPPASRPGLEWLREEGIHGYRVVPIRFKGKPLGAAVAFTRGAIPEPSSLLLVSLGGLSFRRRTRNG